MTALHRVRADPSAKGNRVDIGPVAWRGRAHDCPACLAKAGIEAEEGGDGDE